MYSKFVQALMKQVDHLPQKRAPRRARGSNAVKSLKVMRPVIIALHDKKGFTFKEISAYLQSKLNYKYSASAINSVYSGPKNKAYRWGERAAKPATPAVATVQPKFGRGNRIPDEVRQRLIAAVQSGRQTPEVARELGMGLSTAAHIVAKHRALEGRKGAPKSVTALQDIPRLFGEGQTPNA